MKKATRSEEQGSQSHGQNTTAARKPPSKIARILAHLVAGESLNRFEAERLGDHCLHSTISRLAHGYGLAFQRQPERVPTHWGLPCDLIRYSLPDGEHRRARDVLLMLATRSALPAHIREA